MISSRFVPTCLVLSRNYSHGVRLQEGITSDLTLTSSSYLGPPSSKLSMLGGKTYVFVALLYALGYPPVDHCHFLGSRKAVRSIFPDMRRRRLTKIPEVLPKSCTTPRPSTKCDLVPPL